VCMLRLALYCIVLYCIVLYCIVLYCTVLFMVVFHISLFTWFTALLSSIDSFYAYSCSYFNPENSLEKYILHVLST
jgi:hypothetical protein